VRSAGGTLRSLAGRAAACAFAAALVFGCNAAAGSPRPDGAVRGDAATSGLATPGMSSDPTATPTGSPVPTPGTPTQAPTPAVATGPAWTTESLALLRTAGDAESVVAHVGKAFPLELTSRSTLVAGDRWAEARWQTPGRGGTAWVPLASVTRTRSTRVPSASIDALDARLYAYLRKLGTRVGVEVWDRTRGLIYTHNASRSYLVASSIKVELLCAFLAKLEAAGREPTARERSLMAAMIKRSDNNAAGYFYDVLGEAPGITAYMKRIGVAGLTASPAWRGWGWSTITPAAQVRVLKLLHEGRLLNAKHTKYALDLMRNVIPEHRIGVGTTAPEGADVAMKVGWVTGPDGMWVTNSSGIVTYEGVTYVIAVYTDRDATLKEGFEIVEHVAGEIADALLPRR
jgi:beta-lactamase class A